MNKVMVRLCWFLEDVWDFITRGRGRGFYPSSFWENRVFAARVKKWHERGNR